MKLEPTDALIVVDVQRDFCPGGALAVPEGDRVVPVLRSYIDLFVRRGLPIFFTRDWHPPHHVSFREQGGPWPPHCVAGTPGAEFHPDLPVPPGAEIVSKAEADDDAYSGFERTDLAAKLAARSTRRILVGGLATDYCVRATVLDGLRAGLGVGLLVDAVRAVEVRPGDGDRALSEMLAAGAVPVRLEELS